MKEKHRQAYIDICGVLAGLSECMRKSRKFGAVLVNPESNDVLATGYNGYIRGGSMHCGGNGKCVRDEMHIKSGERMEMGCIHAEENVLINAGRRGVSTVGSWLFVNAEPCALCARRIVQSGVKKVIVRPCGYPGEGINILKENGVEVELA